MPPVTTPAAANETDDSSGVSWGDVQTRTTRSRSGNKNVTKTVVTKTKSSLRQNHSPVYAYEEDAFERRPKTDYTYARSGTYAQKFINNPTSSPNLSRRHIHSLLTDHLAYTDEQVNSIQTDAAVSGNVRSYGSRSRTSISNSHTNQNQSQASLLSHAAAGAASTAANAASTAVIAASTAANAASTVASSASKAAGAVASTLSSAASAAANAFTSERTETTTTTTVTERSSRSNANSNNNAAAAVRRLFGDRETSEEVTETLFSEDETDSMTGKKGGRGATTRSRSRSPSRRRSTRGQSRKQPVQSEPRLSSRSGIQRITEVEEYSDMTDLPSSSYHISNGLDDEAGVRSITRRNTKLNAAGTCDLVTETSRTEIATVATGTPIVARTVGFFLLIYGFMHVLLKRMWWAFGQPIYGVIQRYLLCETWLLSRPWSRKLAGLLCTLLLLLVPFLLLIVGICSMHAVGWVNIQSCTTVTGVYHINSKRDVADLAFFSDRVKNMLYGAFTWSSDHKQHVHYTTTGPVIEEKDWNIIIDEKVSILKQNIEMELNTQVSKQNQKNTEFESQLQQLSRELSELKGRVDEMHIYISSINLIKQQVIELQNGRENDPDYLEMITRLQKDVHALRVKLGDLGAAEEQVGENGVLAFLYTELQNMRNSVPKNVEIPLPCPGSSCVCEGDLHSRLTRLQDELLAEMKVNDGDRTTVFINSDNGTGLSEEIVKKLIQAELDIYSADQTGMPDFALQSMGAQIVSTRCSQTYYETGGLMTWLGVPLYHLHKEPSVVITPGVVPGECWCFHGTEGSLVIELADSIKFNSFSLEHISAKQSGSGEILSAPKDIAIYGLKHEMDYEGHKLGQWTYDRTGPRLQFFPVKDGSTPAYPVVELRVLSNWGRPEFTCLYRFRVHGKISKP